MSETCTAVVDDNDLEVVVMLLEEILHRLLDQPRTVEGWNNERHERRFARRSVARELERPRDLGEFRPTVPYAAGSPPLRIGDGPRNGDERPRIVRADTVDRFTCSTRGRRCDGNSSF